MKAWDYWKDQSDGLAQVEKLSKLHHFCYDADGMRIHFIHERNKGASPIPLILTYSWPGSFLEMLKVIPLLTDPAKTRLTSLARCRPEGDKQFEAPEE